MKTFRGSDMISEQETTAEFIPVQQEKTASKPSASTAKIILWMGLGLFITGVIALCLPYILMGITSDPEVASNIYTTLMVISAFGMFPALLVISIQAMRRNKALIISMYALYSMSMGVMLSSLFLFLTLENPSSAAWTISLSFLITAAIFVLLGFIGTKVKINHMMIWLILGSLGTGVLTISLINIFLGSPTLYLFVELAMLIYIVLFTVIDFNRVKRMSLIAVPEGHQTNLEVYCAFNLYCDFIYIYLQVLRFIAIFRRN